MDHNVNCDFLISFSKKFAKIEKIIVLSTVQFEELEKRHIKPLLQIGILVRRRERILLYKSMFFSSFS